MSLETEGRVPVDGHDVGRDRPVWGHWLGSRRHLWVVYVSPGMSFCAQRSTWCRAVISVMRIG